MYDYIRIDHFRAFDRYYEIEAGAENAINGTWVNANGKEIIDSVHKGNDGGSIIAEDLGIIDDGVRSLLAYAGYPGMKILSFAFDGHEDNLYLPQNITENYVCYTGTHDNDTLIGLITKANFWDKANLVNGVQKSLKLLGIKGKAGDYKVLAKQIIELGYASKANLFILPMQDLLNLSTEYRINEPGTVKEQNWAIRLTSAICSQSNAKELLELTKKYDR
jgi:4-alpha-glucanotransferase